MGGELHDNAEARAFAPTCVESSHLAISNSEMAAFQERQNGGASVADREQAMFANGFNFALSGNIYGRAGTDPLAYNPSRPTDASEKTQIAQKAQNKLVPTDGETVKLDTVLSAYTTAFTEAYEYSSQLKPGSSGKLDMLEETIRRLQSVPWKDKLDVKFDPTAKNPEYDPVNSRITINTKHGYERQIEEFVHEAFHATHQGIGALYINKAKPVSFEEYFHERTKGEVGSFIAEIKVNAEMKNLRPVEFEHVVNGKAVNENLTALYRAKGEEGLRNFLLDARPPLKVNGRAQLDIFQNLQTMESYDEHYANTYQTYKDTFERAKPEAGAVLKEYQNRNPGKGAADFIREGY